MKHFFVFKVFPVALFIATYFLQLRLGYGVSLFPFYMISIGLLTWQYGFKGAVISVFVAFGLWVGGNLWLDVDGYYTWVDYNNAATRAFVFINSAVFVLLFRRLNQKQRLLMESMRGLLQVCQGCGAMKADNGSWLSLGELTQPRNEAPCRCPACSHVETRR